jgi:hypothetical protein
MPEGGTSRLPFRLAGIAPEVAFTALLVVGSGVAALLQGQDSNIDLYRYRLYVGYALLHGRLDQDLAPAALSTYLPPMLEAFHYLGITHLPPRAFSFLLGCLQGLNALVVLLLARVALPDDRNRRLFAMLAALLAATGPTARSLLGTTLGDTTASLPAMLALLIAMQALRGSNGVQTPKKNSVLLLACSGALAGVAVGLKLTMAFACVAIGVLVASALPGRLIPIGAALASLGGVVLGYFAVAGYWGYQLWERFANPLFPFMNQVFRSPYMPATAVRDLRWSAHGLVDYVRPPLDMALGLNERLQEIPFRDVRFLLVLLAALLWLALRVAGRRPATAPGTRFLLVYFLAGYVVWALAFYYYRYASVLEFVAPLVLVLLVQAAFPTRARTLVVAATVFVLLTTTVGSWGRLGFGERWFNVRLPPAAQEPDSLVLLDSPLSSFLIPYFPSHTRFAGLEGTGSKRLDELVAARIAAHRGALFWLVSRGRPAPSDSPERFGLAVTDDCGLIRTGEGRWALCRLARARGPR